MRKYRIDQNDRGMYPMGLTRTERGIHVSVAAEGTECALLLFSRGGKAPKARIIFPEECRIGDVWSMTVLGEFNGLEYSFEVDGQEIPDICGRAFSGLERWGEPACRKNAPRGIVEDQKEEFDWQGDRLPQIPYEDCVIYHIHVRGLTRHPSSGLPLNQRGTFRAVASRIPYMKDLGITTIEMMPPTEFDECILPKEASGMGEPAWMTQLRKKQAEEAESQEEPEKGEEKAPEKPLVRLNYWGYKPGLPFAPKSAYSCSRGRSNTAAVEFKELVRELHRAGLELVIELYCDGSETPVQVLELVRFWAQEYHVDGVHLIGYAPLALLARDPYLSRLKLWAESWEGADCGRMRHLAEYRSDFMLDMRSFLKGDEGRLGSLMFHTRHNPEHMGVIHYMANVNGFTLMDMVSYDKKHNEANGEENRDGTDYNQSWNCGAEGPTRRKKIQQLRRKQLRNAALLLLLSQGTPLLAAGDEFGATKLGNNNSYCQDNEISWINWRLQKTNSSLYEFMKYAIAFRREHPIFHMEREAANMDYRSLGLPDVSYHGEKAWRPEMDSFRRQLGIFYCGRYGKRKDGSEDNYFYVAYNMHWEPHEFSFPNLPKGLKWHVAFDTDDGANNGFYPPGQEPELLEGKRMAAPRSILVLIGKPEEKQEGQKHAAK